MFKPDCIVFDLDGTLLDSGPDLWRANTHALAEAGLAEVPYTILRDHFGRGALSMLRGSLRHLGEDEEKAEDLLPPFLDHYRDNCTKHSSLYSGAIDALHTLKDRGYDLAVCTNKPQYLTDLILEGLELTPLFSAIIGGDHYPYRKPDPRHLLGTISEAGGTTAVMVGDSLADFGAAKAAKVPFIGVTFGYCSADLAADEADAMIDHFGELVGLIGDH